MWELDHKKGWALKNGCFWTVVLEKTLESHLDCKEIQPVHPKGNQSWIFTGRSNAEAEALILWPPDMKSWLIRKDPDAEKVWGQEEKGTTEDEMLGCHHQLNGHEFEQTPGDSRGQGSPACCGPRDHKESDMTEDLITTTEDEMTGWHHWLDGCESEWTSGVGDGQGGLACCSPWGHKESDTTERLNWTELRMIFSELSCSAKWRGNEIIEDCIPQVPRWEALYQGHGTKTSRVNQAP